jgi:dephospho-CoA kinase
MKVFKSFKEQYLQEGVYDPGIFKAYFLAGGPGSGKSFVTSGAFGGLGLKLVNSDSVLTRNLEKEGLSLKMPDSEKDQRDKLRDKAKVTVAAQLDLYIQGRLGCIMDGTARNFALISRQQRLFKFLGYQTTMLFVNTSLDVALERNAKRDRTVPKADAIKNWNTVQSNMGQYQRLFGAQNMYIIDNNRSEKELVTLTLNKCASIVRRTMNQPHGYIAQQWIKRELDRKKR